MKPFFVGLLTLVSFVSCGKKITFAPRNFNAVEIETLLRDSLLNVRAIDIVKDEKYNLWNLFYTGNNKRTGEFRFNNVFKDKVENKGFYQFDRHDSLNIHFRSIANTDRSTFVLSIESPARLFRKGRFTRNFELVYQENHPKSFLRFYGFLE